MNEGAVQMAPFTNMPADVAAKAQEIKDAISNGEYFAFTGPIRDNKGNLQLADGEVADDAHLNSMMYYVEGIDAEVPEADMIPVIDFQSESVLEEIREAYTTVGFAVFINALPQTDQEIMNNWFEDMKEFFTLDLDVKKKYSYDAETNLGYSVLGAENVDPTAPKDLKESFNYNNTRMDQSMWPREIYGFKVSALNSVRIADQLTIKILEKFDKILDCGTTLVDAHAKPYNTTRVIHYLHTQDRSKINNNESGNTLTMELLHCYGKSTMFPVLKYRI